MSDDTEPLVRDLVVWCAASPRTYAEVIGAWRTSCPRLMVWEEAIERRWLETRNENGILVVRATPAGHAQIAPVLASRSTIPRAPPIANARPVSVSQVSRAG